MIFKSNTMELNIKNGGAYLTFNSLKKLPFINHAFSTRLGGISQNQFSHMNLAFGRGDSDENVLKNYMIFSQMAGFDFDSLVSSNQTHHTVIRRVYEKDRGVGITKPADMESVDSLITNDKNVTLVTHYADCVPVYLVDTKNKAIGLLHSGWRGTVAEISKLTVEAMTKEFGTKPQDVYCAIGPAINQCCFEVDKPVADEFYKMTHLDIDKFIKSMDNGKYHIDLLEVCRQSLVTAGVMNENISVSDVCTKCNCDLIFSHRATMGKRGGASAFLALK